MNDTVSFIKQFLSRFHHNKRKPVQNGKRDADLLAVHYLHGMKKQFFFD